MSFQIRFQGDVPHSRRITAECQASSDALMAEFPEVVNLEVSLGRTGEEFDVHVHVTGRKLSLAAKAHQRSLGEAVHTAFTRTERQLRKQHDKQIFARRREMQRSAPN